MKTFFFSATSVAVLLALYVAGDALAQRAPAAAGPAPNIGIVDISYIFKNHIRFQAQMDAMKQDAEATKNKIMKEKERITKMMEELKRFKPGTAEYKKLEEDITRQQSDFNATAALQQKEFMERESQVYMSVYKEVADAVAYVSQSKGMTLVLRFNGDPVEATSRESVLREINKPVVFYSKQADITPHVLAEVNRGQDPPRGNTGGGAARRPGVPANNPQR